MEIQSKRSSAKKASRAPKGSPTRVGRTRTRDRVFPILSQTLTHVHLHESTVMNGYAELDVSLEPELLNALNEIHPLLPEDVASRLTSVLESSPPSGKARTVPYTLLLDVSKWTRTDPGREAISNKSLRESDYAMISLLAGTRTAPNRRFPPPPKPELDPRRELNDRRAITTVINSLLSIFGAGWAVWLAAGQVGWRDEWV